MKKLLTICLYITGVIIFWQLCCSIGNIPSYILPTPLEVYSAFSEHATQLWDNTRITGLEIFIGFVIANILSTLLALTIAFFPRIEAPAISTAVICKTLPVIAIAPMLVLWFGPGIWSKVAAVVFVCFFPALVNILRGIKSLDSSVQDPIRLYSPSRLQTMRYFILPGIRPYMYSALKVSSSLAVVGALVGEFISANSGLGFMIISSYYSLNIALVFAVLIIVSLIGLLMYGGLHMLEVRDDKKIAQVS